MHVSLSDYIIFRAQKKVAEFLEKDENSRMTAGKKETITRRKTKKHKRLLNDSLINLRIKFVNSYPEYKKMPYSTFCF